MMFGGMGWGGGMLLGSVFMILFWVFLIAGAAWLALAIGRQGGDRTAAPGRSAAPAILEERLARGEIDVEEYRARKAAMGESR